MNEIRIGTLTGEWAHPDGSYPFAVAATRDDYCVLLFKRQPPSNSNHLAAYPDWAFAMADGYTHGWAVGMDRVIWAPPAPVQPYDYGQLTLVEMYDDYNLHEDRDGNEVYLQHVTGKVLVEFNEMDIRALFRQYQAKAQSLSFFDWLKDLTYEPDAVDDYVVSCGDCGTPDHEDEMTGVDGDRSVCEKCSANYTLCRNCEERCREGSTRGDGNWICDYCCSELYTYCEDCETYYPDDDNHSHYDDDDGRCNCDSPATRFTVRNDGLGPLANDTRTTISLGAGEISDEGLAQIRRALYRHPRTVLGYLSDGTPTRLIEDRAEWVKWENLSHDLDPLGNKWQAKDGNFTKRLSRHAYKIHGLKIPPEVISEIGNIASAHSRGADYHLEVTRELNLPAVEFGNEGSCWWNESGYRRARCALKTNGGFGLRTFHSQESGEVAGRAWVQPLMWTGQTTRPRSSNACSDPTCCTPPVETGVFKPTFNAQTPDAFIVFNGYGNLVDYAPARIVAHMAGMTYRKVGFTVGLDDGTYYVNGESGYLVAPEELADRFTDKAITLDLLYHSDLFDTEQVTAAIISTEIKEHANA